MASDKCRTEFYVGDDNISSVGAILPARKGETVAILGKFYTVTRVSWAVDHADDFARITACCAVFLKESP